MDTRSRSPESPRRRRRRGPSFRVKLLLRLLGLLLVAAIVVGIGTTTNKEWGPDFRGDEPQISAQEAASRNMLDLARKATDLATEAGSTDDSGALESASPPSGLPEVAPLAVNAKSAQELERASTLLQRHVELLTPGLAMRVAQETAPGPENGASARAGGADLPDEPSGNPMPTIPSSGSEALAQVAHELGTSANNLLEAASTANPSQAAAVLGAGIEQRLEAQRLSALVSDDAKVQDLPPVEITASDQAWNEALAHRLPPGSCTLDGVPSASASPDATSSAEAPTSEQQRAAASISEASDAAFRQAYGYQMAAVKFPGASTHGGWKLSTTASELGHRLEDLLPDDCSPTRATAYALPGGFGAAPIGSVAESEEQLAALLRDAAARMPEALRPVLVAETWLAADRSFDLAGTIPDLTKTS